MIEVLSGEDGDEQVFQWEDGDDLKMEMNRKRKGKQRCDRWDYMVGCLLMADGTNKQERTCQANRDALATPTAA